MDNERMFWEGFYRGLLLIAQAIKQYKLGDGPTPKPERMAQLGPRDPAKAREWFRAVGVRVDSARE